jgi:hypothetical protein
MLDTIQLTLDKWHLTHVTRCMTLNTWCSRHSTWHLTPDPWHLTPDAEYLTHDIWLMTLGHMILDTWHMTHDTWHMTHDTWHLAHDNWQKNTRKNTKTRLISIAPSCDVTNFWPGSPRWKFFYIFDFRKCPLRPPEGSVRVRFWPLLSPFLALLWRIFVILETNTGRATWF